MSRSKAAATPPTAVDRQLQSSADPAARDAAFVTGSTLPATAVVGAYLGQSIEPRALLDQLNARATAVHDGDLRQIEDMLLHQAVALQAMFTDLACRAKAQGSLSSTQVLTQMALRAQSCSRATLQTLIELKNPRQVAFVQQANLAHNQQINNAVAPPPRVESDGNVPNKLFVEGSQIDGRQAMDTRATATASRVDPQVAPLAPRHGPSNRGRQASRRA
jgi:hypothetical protein